MATFRRRGAKWQAQIRLHGHPARSRTFATKRDAEVWARQIEASFERGDLPGSWAELKTVTLLQMLERYEATVMPRNHEIFMAGLALSRLGLSPNEIATELNAVVGREPHLRKKFPGVIKSLGKYGRR